MIFDELYNIVEDKVNSFPSTPITRIKDIHSSLIMDTRIRDILEFEIPEIEDISDILEAKKGKVYAVRMDKTYGLTGFKKPVIGSLILKRLIEAVKRKDYNKKWIDGGNVNSSLALAYYANKFEGKATYVMSRFFPENALKYIREISNDSIQLIEAPNLSLGIERDFYKYLVQLVRTDQKYKTYQPLWHAKYSGEYSQFLGDDLSKTMKFCPDNIVAILGAGSTIQGQAIPIKSKFKNHPKIIVPEHSQSPLLNLGRHRINILNKLVEKKDYSSDWFSKPPNGIPHMVLGPHYDEINPLIKKDVLKCIDYVYRYEDDDWKRMSYNCYRKGLKIGNSSAANLVIAKHLAEKGNIVLTFIYEPFRSIYQGRDILENESNDLRDKHQIETPQNVSVQRTCGSGS